MALTVSELDELRRLLPVARTARRQHGPSSPQGRASARVTAILATAFAEERATVRELAAETGISYHSVARRIRLATGAPVRRRRERPPRPSEVSMEEAASRRVAPEVKGENPSSARDVRAHAQESLLPELPAYEPSPTPEPPAEELARFEPGPNDLELPL